MSTQELVRITDLTKSFGAAKILHSTDLRVDTGEIVMLLGPSGAGKSTLLRCINRIEDPSSGDIVVNGQSMVHSLRGGRQVAASAKELAFRRRAIGMVFQRFHLFPHLSAIDNVAVGPHKVLGVPMDVARREAQALLQRVKLEAHGHKKPQQLSGGQQQRVGIARALAMKPDLLLLDEPTSALDPELVAEVLDVVKSLAQEGMTMIIVTHELAFARDVGSRIVFMEQGRIRVDTTPREFFGHICDERIRTFVRQSGELLTQA
ncbi:amino acid ABC transporter ATP-binding protein [Comamonas thiooxydans]|uniref:amino acid ABC transporter ATP-binding protein n=1 Tax=Comamonas thiooxydans TaxID=363952 RepID=UPI00244BDA2D|nr:amino acid ABC transporter ATP-binding protein [Comamonas thiooxydans]MDH1475295.1 amino acid ABC transporter ATP-binding protein [Comamonas thiooxydans]